MATMTNDVVVSAGSGRSVRTGTFFALVSAVSFGLAGGLARPLLDAGWSSGAITLLRVWIAVVVLLPLGLRALDGRWGVLWASRRIVAGYAVFGVVLAQFCYFSAMRYMDAGPALLIEYTAPVLVVVWLWLRHGQRPRRVALAGAGLALVGLVLVLDLMSGADVHPTGALWAAAAMLGAAGYFIFGADDSTGLPPLTLATAGLALGGCVLVVLGVSGLLPVTVSTQPVGFRGADVPWWLPILVLGVVTAALAYGAGAAAMRELGSRLSSFVALSEVLAVVLWAWLLLGQVPGSAQLLGGVAILAGVILVKLGEPTGGPGPRSRSRSARVLPPDEDLPGEHQDRRGGRDRQQRADDTEQARTHQRRDHRDRTGDLHRP